MPGFCHLQPKMFCGIDCQLVLDNLVFQSMTREAQATGGNSTVNVGHDACQAGLESRVAGYTTWIIGEFTLDGSNVIP